MASAERPSRRFPPHAAAGEWISVHFIDPDAETRARLALDRMEAGQAKSGSRSNGDPSDLVPSCDVGLAVVSGGPGWCNRFHSSFAGVEGNQSSDVSTWTRLGAPIGAPSCVRSADDPHLVALKSERQSQREIASPAERPEWLAEAVEHVVDQAGPLC